MSGIAGIYTLDGRQVSPEELTALIGTLSHRGADRSASYLAGQIGVIHCMLHTTQESIGEKLPYADPLSGHIITADARLDNREDLLDDLDEPHALINSIPDSQLILAAYKKWGEDCAGKLIGDFAFAIWDPHKPQLFCARDHMGVKPFYYFHSKNAFIFGSEIKAILQSEEVASDLNEQRILDYLVFYHSDHSSTFFNNIHRLPARHSLRVTPHSIRVEPYWDFSPEIEIHFRKDEDYADAFREHFDKAVACRLRTITPVGAFLSGGLDSSSIACVAAGQMKKMEIGQLITFSGIFDSLPPHVSWKADERVFMDAAIRQCGSEAHFIQLNEHGPLRNIDYSEFDEPMPYFNGYLLDETCTMAQKRGVRVLLDGTDGDTTVSHGYERLYDLGTRYRFLTLLAEAKKFCRLNNLTYSRKKILWKYCVRPSIPDVFVNIWKRAFRHRTDDPTKSLAGFLAQTVADSTDWNARARLLAQKESYFRKGRLPQYWSFISPFLQYTMEFIDTRSSRYPVEIRYPFWDRRLMEFCLALPLEQKMKNGLTRVVLRRAMKGILPHIIEHRQGKANLSPQFLMEFDRTAAPYINQLLESNSEIKKYLKSGYIERKWVDFRQYPYRKADIAMDLYVFITLDAWLRKNRR